MVTPVPPGDVDVGAGGAVGADRGQVHDRVAAFVRRLRSTQAGERADGRSRAGETEHLVARADQLLDDRRTDKASCAG